MKTADDFKMFRIHHANGRANSHTKPTSHRIKRISMQLLIRKRTSISRKRLQYRAQTSKYRHQSQLRTAYSMRLICKTLKLRERVSVSAPALAWTVSCDHDHKSPYHRRLLRVSNSKLFSVSLLLLLFQGKVYKCVRRLSNFQRCNKPFPFKYPYQRQTAKRSIKRCTFHCKHSPAKCPDSCNHKCKYFRK